MDEQTKADIQELINAARDTSWDIPETMEAVERLEKLLKEQK